MISPQATGLGSGWCEEDCGAPGQAGPASGWCSPGSSQIPAQTSHPSLLLTGHQGGGALGDLPYAAPRLVFGCEVRSLWMV